MSASLINFESAREKEQQRQFERKARQSILEKAQKEYEAKEQKQQEARQRGEHTWMLPSVEAKLAQDTDTSRTKKKKKKDKKKKKKKEKKAKKKKRESSSSSSDSDEDEEDKEVWVESSSTATPKPPPSQPAPKPHAPDTHSTGEAMMRDGWMEMTSLFGTFSREEMREREGTSRKKAKEEEERRKREADKPGSHARELNPYYKDGGTGLPVERPKASAAPQTSGLDAGWLHRALQRAKEQAEAEGRKLEDVAAERWGSLARFNELLAEAEGRGKQRESDTRSQSRRRESRSRERDRRRNRSGSRERDRRSRSRERERNRRSRSYERGNERSRKKERSRSRERRRRHSSSSSSGSSSSSRSSSNRSRGREKDCREDRREDSSAKFSQKLLRPSNDPEKSGGLSLRFQKPGEENASRYRPASWSTPRATPSSSNRWQKKEHRQMAKEQDRKPQSPSPSSSSSSSSSSSDSDDDTTGSSTAIGKGGEREAPTTTTTTAATKQPPPTTAAPPAAPLTDKEMNELAAKIMKAELVGNEAQAAKLKARLESARAMRAAGSGAALGGKVEEGGTTEQVVVLTRTDGRGVSRPVVGGDEEAGRGRKRTKVKTHSKDGQRARYFPDDDQQSLKNMFEKEKGTTADDQNAMFEKAATLNPERLNDDYDIDDMFMSKTALKDSSAKQAERDKKKAIQEHQRIERSLESCQWCFDSKEMPKHLIVALGTKCYVSLPAHQSLTPGHCCIAPIHHITCCIQAEEDLWDEVQSFRKSLVRMFTSRGEDCIFFETVKRLRHFPHMVLHCVPLPRETGDMAPIYFKKAIMECEQEWAQNKKLVDLKGRDVRRAVPKGLPYFFVDFAMDAGFAHVIEDEQEFPNHFAQEIVGGMLDLDNNLWRKPRRENFDTQRRKVMEFSRWYKDFDPTQEG